MEVQGKHHTIASLWYKGKMIIRTRVSHGRGEIHGNIPHKIRQQLKVNEEQLDKLMDCTYGKNDYIGILDGKGLLPRNVC